jgi:hypothetical protein
LKSKIEEIGALKMNEDVGMIKQVMEDIRAMSAKLDDHITSQHDRDLTLQKDVGKIWTQLEGHKTRIAAFTTAIAVMATGFANWFLGGFKQ